jgi:hypothetical protein
MKAIPDRHICAAQSAPRPMGCDVRFNAAYPFIYTNMVLNVNLPLYQIAQSVYRRCGQPGFDSRQQKEIFLVSTLSRPALGPIQPLTQCISGVLSPGIKRPEREADHSPPSSAAVKNCGAIPPLPRTSS